MDDERMDIVGRIILSGQLFVDNMEEMKGMTPLFNPRVKYHAERTLFHLDKSVSKLFAAAGESSASMLALYDLDAQLLREINGLTLDGKQALLAQLLSAKKEEDNE